MSYHFFGSFGDDEDEIIEEAKKQKKAEDVVSAALNPINFAVRNGAKAVTGKKPGIIKEEDYIKALIIKTLKQNGIIGDLLDQRIKELIDEVLRENRLHPQWRSVLPRK